LVILAAAFVTVASSGMAAEQRVKVAIRDGAKIDTFFRTPVGNGPWPAVFKKGYGITTGDAETLVKAGCALVSQGVRSGPDPHGISGDTRFFAADVDGYDTIEWIAKQPWCDGNVAMFGPSYWGATQWLAAANGDPGRVPRATITPPG
jgi:hypothetical protein